MPFHPAIKPGTLRLVRGTPNPRGVPQAQLFLFVGNPAAGPIHEVVPAPGIALPGPPGDLVEHGFRLRILHFNDLHGHLVRIHSYGDWPVFSRIVWRLRQQRRKYDSDPRSAVLTLSAGDDLIGSLFDELLGTDAESFKVHAGYRLYSAAGVDAAVLGNHDLDMGAALLAQAVRRDARFPLLSANLIGCQQLAGLYYPAVLLVVKGVRVGIVGLTTPAEIKAPGEGTLRIAHPVEVAHNLLPALRPLCDVLIVLSHLGRSLNSGTATVLKAGDVELAESLPPSSVHLIVGGHTHHVLNMKGLSADNIVNGIPIVQAGELGRFVGEVDILLRPQAAVANARLTATDDLPADEEFEEVEVQPLVARVRELLARPLGICDDHPDLTTDAVRNTFAAGESALANFVTDAMVACCRAAGYDVDFAVVDASSIRCGLPAGGPITFGDWFDIMPFADTIRICQITGQQLKLLLDDNARRADRPGEPHTERGFLHFSRQVRYKVVLGEERRAAHAWDVTVDGRPLAEQLERTFRFACTSFVREAALPWEARVGQTRELPTLDMRRLPVVDIHLFLRHELVAYIREHGGVTEAGGARRDGRVVFVDRKERNS